MTQRSTFLLSLQKFTRYLGREWLSSLTFQRIFLVLFAIGLYANTFTHEYATEGSRLLSQSNIAHKGLGVDGIMNIFQQDSYAEVNDRQAKFIPANEHYQPVTLLTFAIEYTLFGEKPQISHIINVILYAITGLLLLSVLNRIFKGHLEDAPRIILAFVATLIFLAHPVHTEIVASIKGRNELLSFLWLLLMTYLLLRAAFARGAIRFVYLPLVAASFFLALLTEETAISFMFILPLILYYFIPLRKVDIFVLAIPVLFTAIGYWFLRDLFTKDIDQSYLMHSILNNPFASADLSQKISTLIFAFAKYIELLIAPINLSHDYSFNQVTLKEWTDIRVVMTFLGIIGAGIISIANIRKKGIYTFTYFYFIGYLLFIYVTEFLINPDEFVFLSPGTIVSEKLLYLPSLAFCIATAFGLYDLFGWLVSNKRRAAKWVYTYTFVGTLLVLVLYSIKTVVRNKVWENDMTLMKADVKNSPNSVRLRYMLGRNYIIEADTTVSFRQKARYLEKAAEQLRQAVTIHPSYADAIALLGTVYTDLGQEDKAGRYYKRAIQINPKSIVTQEEYGKMCFTNGDYHQAVECFKQWGILEMNPTAFLYLGKTYEFLEQPDSATAAYGLVVSFKDADYNEVVGDAYYRMANIYVDESSSDSTINRNKDAVDLYLKSVSKNKRNLDAYLKLSKLYEKEGKVKKAIYALEGAIIYFPKSEKLYRTIAKLYELEKDNKKQLFYIEQADSVSALNKEDEKGS
ncbi:tetratricopeptide repeat protein [Bernardetia litoralis DSM 6794]|uniref:Tetratricopeptide repeat protein n=1 Tax=Bernardetia litoralis (strain ATCC 23117 / DSM 6794 / NBRC 15988 / NCIMB 1366 / Fx l1 / Sio-4) TaxID=880071 RepID=I4AFW5_BERLS|nr:tetratricopeptide repeat protein [Bernardetia litoralis]AFM02850.1 tetratricopeptide repeat protein [Bernardetia litoralis DSM 6794]